MIIKNDLSILFVFVAILASLYLLWVIIPMFSGLPWIPTRQARIRQALHLARVSPGDVIYDLGSGDGRVLILAVREFGVHAVGIEISPIHCVVAKINAYIHGVNDHITIRWSSFYTANYSDADVVFLYMTSRQATRIRPRLEKQLHQGARVITISCEINGWHPVDFDREELIFIYRMGSSSELHFNK